MHDFILKLGGPTIVIFIGGIISAIGAVWAAYEKSASGEKMANKNEEIIRLNRAINDSITGGNSYCYVSFFGKGNDTGFVIVHHGEYPLYDLSVRMVDLDVFAKNRANPMAGATEALIGNLSPSSSIFFAQLPMSPSETVKRFNIFFSARNGFWNQQFTLVKKSNNWENATRVWKHDKDRKEVTLMEMSSTSFPKKQDGSVDWKKPSPDQERNHVQDNNQGE